MNKADKSSLSPRLLQFIILLYNFHGQKHFYNKPFSLTITTLWKLTPLEH